MAADAVYDAIKAFLEDQANVSGLADPVTGEVPPIRFENETFTPPEKKAWISMSLSGVLYGQASIGAPTQADNRWDEGGTLWLPVFVPVGSGSSRPRQLAKQIADLFRGRTMLSGNLEFLDAFIGEGGQAQEEGNWFELPLGIEFGRVEA